jgi:hypothetical protein
MFRIVVPAVVMAAAILGSPAPVAAQPFGTFVWQTQPFCNRLALTLTSTPGGFTVAGTDDGCNSARKASVTGALLLNGDGTAGLRVSIAPTDGARVVDLWATVSTAHGGGSWSDSAGHSGPLTLGGYVGGLPIRPSSPTPIDVADNPASQDDPCFAAVRPETPTLCGDLDGHWKHGAIGLPGLQIWKDADGRVHLRGSVFRTSALAPKWVVSLPPSWRPKRTLAMSVATSRLAEGVGGTAFVIFFGDDFPQAVYHGLVFVNFQTDPQHGALHFAEIVLTVDR